MTEENTNLQAVGTEPAPPKRRTRKMTRPRTSQKRTGRKPKISENGAALPAEEPAPQLAAPAPPSSEVTEPVVSEPQSEEPVSPPAAQPSPAPPTFAEGVVEVSGKGFGFLREPRRNFSQSNNDVFVTPEVVRKHALRDGMWIKGETRRGNRGPQLFRLVEIEGRDPENFQNLPVFEELTTINPNKRIRLETVPERYTTRIMDLMTPDRQGPARPDRRAAAHRQDDAAPSHRRRRGQESPEMKLIILLVDERPEEVTDIRRSCPRGGNHGQLERQRHQEPHPHRAARHRARQAPRRGGQGCLHPARLDHAHRPRLQQRAWAAADARCPAVSTARAMEIPRKIFAAARNTEEAGSLTIVATALIETGSRMDELIFQEFKGTGNMELVLDRKISDQRIYPAVDIFLSGTRREELLLSAEELDKINVIRRGLAGHKPIEAIERLLFFIRKYPTNAELLRNIPG